MKEPLLVFLQKFGDIPDEVLEQIQSQQDMEVLKNWMQTAVRSKSWKSLHRRCKKNLFLMDDQIEIFGGFRLRNSTESAMIIS